MNALKFSGLIVLQGISRLSQPLPMDQGQAKVPVRRHGLTVLNLAHDIWMVNIGRPCWIQEGKLNQSVICPKNMLLEAPADDGRFEDSLVWDLAGLSSFDFETGTEW